MGPLDRGEICVVDQLKRRLDDVVRVLEPSPPEEVGRFDDGRGEYVKSRMELVTPSSNTCVVVSRGLQVKRTCVWFIPAL